MGRLYYFAYGSNLHPQRLCVRIPGASVLGRARLRGHRLKFHKLGRDLSAKCDAYQTGRDADMVHGVVYRIARGDWRILDREEERGRGYDRVRLWVSTGGRKLAVSTYLARREAIVDGLRPFDWYLDYVCRGALHHGLPGRYLERLRRVVSVPDDNLARRSLNRCVSLRGAPQYRRR